MTRRDVLISRYQMLSEYNCPGFIDFQVGINDAIWGKIFSLDSIGTIRTHSFQHAYFRPTQPLVYLRYAERILAYRDHVAAQLATSEPSNDKAMTVASDLVQNRVLELSGAGAKGSSELVDDPRFRDKKLEAQIREFYAMFSDGTRERQAIRDKLAFISRNLHDGLADNDGRESQNYETL